MRIGYSLLPVVAGVIGVLCVGPAGAVSPTSGLQPTEKVEPWNPIHVSGPDKGTNACPVCTYLEKPVVVVFAKDTANTVHLINKLESLGATKRKTGLRIVVAVTDATPERLAKITEDLKLVDVSLCHLNPKTRAADLKAYRIDATAENTIMCYKDYTVTASFVDLSVAGFDRLSAAITKLVP